MRSPSDPTRVWKRRERVLLTIGLVAPAAILVWALQPLPQADPLDPTIITPTPSDETTEGLAPFNRTAFAAPVWNPEPVPANTASTTTARERTAPPIRLQLIGIVHDTDEEGEEVLRAALYDPATDTLHIVASGGVIGGITVSMIDDEGVALESSGRTSRLALRDEHADGGRR